MAMAPIPPDAPGRHLIGLDLPGDWRVVRAQTRPPNATGGVFSLGYYVQNTKDGREGFLKAIDISRELASGDPVRLQQMTEIFNFERDLLDLCKNASRVITAIAHGSIPPGTIPGTIAAPVFYLIFELASSDARQQVNLRSRLPLGEVFEALHQVTAGLSQLHREYIAHQDIKPSNILYMRNPIANASADTRLGDLGRAAHEHKGLPALHAGLTFMGTTPYTPPELLYGQLSADWKERRYGCDLYSLGSMIAFFFCGQPTNAFLVQNLDVAHRWGVWSGDYPSALPFVQSAFAKALADIRPLVQQYIDPGNGGAPRRKQAVDDVVLSIEQLCQPDSTKRGHPSSLGGGKNQFDLQRYLSLFDMLARRARAGMI